MFKTYINEIPEYDDENFPFYLQQKFLKSFEVDSSPNKSLLFLNEKSILYSNILNINLSKGLYYNDSNFIIKLFLYFIKIKICFFGNWYLNNLYFYNFKNLFDVKTLLTPTQNLSSAQVIPDYLMYALSNKNNIDFIKINIEDDMIFEINKNWKSFDNYLNDLRSKYRKKVKNIYLKSENLKMKKMTLNDFELHHKRIKVLFNQVVNDSKFSGPLFNILILKKLMNNDFLKLYGYFLKDKLVGFSTYIDKDQNFISYYVGYDKKNNSEFSIYPRMLMDKIKLSINLNKEKIIFGRTSNEFKSNFGATPIESKLFIKFNNPLLHKCFKYIFKQSKNTNWTQRNPFKK